MENNKMIDCDLDAKAKMKADVKEQDYELELYLKLKASVDKEVLQLLDFKKNKQLQQFIKPF